MVGTGYTTKTKSTLHKFTNRLRRNSGTSSNTSTMASNRTEIIIGTAADSRKMILSSLGE